MNPELRRLEAEAEAALAAGRLDGAMAAWTAIVRLDPKHVNALTAIGRVALQHGDAEAASVAFQRVLDADGQDPRQWNHLAMARERLNDDAGVEAALARALALDPYDLVALMLRGRLYERQGREHQAASTYGAAATVAPPIERLAPEWRPTLQHALQFRAAYQQRFGAFLDAALAPARADVAPADRRRIDLAVDIMLGRQRRFDSQPMLFYVPGLVPTEFFERDRFPWLDAIEAGTGQIRDEFLAVLRDDAGFAPYIQYGRDQPVAQWAELNHNPRWSAFHLVKNGQPVPGNAERCPRTMALWRTAPVPDQPGRTPVSLFSLLKPRTRIPPHVGASNTRLLTHLPLIVPPGCSFRVGNTVREWVPGKAWVFDDTIEHEARNDSDELRVIMIFDIWHPDLRPEERHLITAFNAAMNEFNADSAAGFDA